MIHKRWLTENNNEKLDIEFWCPETIEENKKFNELVTYIEEKVSLLNYFIGG